MSIAADDLIEEGLVHSVPNRGYFVRADTESAAPAGDVDVREEIRALRTEMRQLAERLARLEEQVNG